MDEKAKEKAQAAMREEIELYGKLKELSKTSEFQNYLEWLTNQTVGSMMQIYFGDKAPTPQELLDNWSLVRGKMLVLQEVGGAELVQKQLTNQLKNFNNPDLA